NRDGPCAARRDPGGGHGLLGLGHSRRPHRAHRPGGAVIVIENLSKRLGEAVIVDDVSMEVEEGRIAVVVGASGAGKSSLLRMINRLVAPTSGRVLIDGMDTMLTPEDALRRRIGYVIQGNG